MRLPPALERPLRRVEARIRVQRALDAGTLLVVPGAVVAALALGSIKTGLAAPARATPFLFAALSLPLLGLAIGAMRRVPSLLAAELLDRAHGLKSRVANALEFARLPDAERTAFMAAAVDDAVTHGPGLRPERALPLRRPKDLAPAVCFVALAALVAALEVPVPRRLPAPRLPPAAMLDADTLEGFRAELSEVLEEPPRDPEIAEVGRELNRVLEDIADRRLDRTDALRELAELERRLAEGRPANAETMERALREMGRRLDGSTDLTAASEALADANAARAGAALREVAEAVRGEAMSRAELAALRRSLERAAERRTEAEQELAETEERTERLLEQRRREAAEEAEEEQESLLRRRRRELERLERQRDSVSEHRRRLERLRREMETAAEDLNRRDRNSAADALSRGAEELNRTAREQMSEEQRRELEAQMRQLREMIRRQREQQGGDGQDGQGGQAGQGGQGQRLQRFVLRAQGQGGQPMRLRMPGQGQGQGQGQAGQGQGQAGQGQGQAGQGQGQAGQGQGQAGQGQGQAGQGQGQGQGGEGIVELTMGQGGNAMLEIPGMGEGREGPGEGGGRSGGGAGTEHDPDLLGDPTHLNSRGQSSQLRGQHGDGPSRSEVILGAADRGFATSGYRRVFTDYSDHAEEVLERDEVPAGYRFYVKRYFQLIRPREGAAAEETSR